MVAFDFYDGFPDPKKMDIEPNRRTLFIFITIPASDIGFPETQLTPRDEIMDFESNGRLYFISITTSESNIDF